MKAFENLEILSAGQPADKEVLARISRDELCQGNPLSDRCTFATAKDEFLLADLERGAICRECEVFELKRQQMIADWEAWALAMQDVYA